MDQRAPDVPGSAQRALGSRYVLDSVLGSGAMGQVWAAHDAATGEPVAAKLLRTEFARDPQLVGRFVQERSILLELRHPHVVRVRDLVVEGDDLALVMDLVRGPDLRKVLDARGRLAPEEATRLVVDVLDALAYAHGRGVLHRDVKPDNVLLTDDDPPLVQLADFGIARLAQETTVRMTGVIGTPEYMAPEVFTDELVSPAADVYATGIVWYELMAGTTPFAGQGNAYAIAHRQVTAAPPPLPGLPPAVTTALDALLRKDPRTRPAAAEAAAELRRLLPSLSGLAPLPAPARPESWTAPDDDAAPGIAVRGGAAEPPADPHATAVRGLRRPAPGTPVGDPGAPAEEPSGTGGPLPAEDDGPCTGGRRPVRRHPAAPLARPARRRRRPGRRGACRARRPAPVVAPPAGPRRRGRGAGRGRRRRRAHPRRRVRRRELVGPPRAAAVRPPCRSAGGLEQAASGLSVLRQAEYDPAHGQATVTVTFTAASAALTGPFFKTVPAPLPAHPAPTWSGTAPAPSATPRSASTRAPAAGRSTVATVGAGSQVQARYSVPYTPAKGTDPRTALAAQQRCRAEADLRRPRPAHRGHRLPGAAAGVPRGRDRRIGAGGLADPGRGPAGVVRRVECRLR